MKGRLPWEPNFWGAEIVTTPETQDFEDDCIPKKNIWTMTEKKDSFEKGSEVLKSKWPHDAVRILKGNQAEVGRRI